MQIGGVECEYEEGDYVLGIVIPILAGEAVDPDKAENGADGDGKQTDENAGTAHAFEEIEGGQAPDDFAELAIAQQAILSEINEAEDEGQGEGGVGKDAESDVQGEDGAARGRGGEAVGGREMGGEKKDQDEGDDEGAHGTLAMVELESEISEGEQPAE